MDIVTDTDHQLQKSDNITIDKVVEIQNLAHFFGRGELKKQILFDINLTLKTGEVVILKGPSGSGKTTLLTLMGGLRSPQEGS
ncbi:MAG: ATP-binding cassette domain-containing protein, partial [Cyanobacteria bacterium J06638_38]